MPDTPDKTRDIELLLLCAIIAHVAGEESEGWLIETLGVDRMTLRGLRYDAQDAATKIMKTRPGFPFGLPSDPEVLRKALDEHAKWTSPLRAAPIAAQRLSSRIVAMAGQSLSSLGEATHEEYCAPEAKSSSSVPPASKETGTEKALTPIPWPDDLTTLVGKRIRVWGNRREKCVNLGDTAYTVTAAFNDTLAIELDGSGRYQTEWRDLLSIQEPSPPPAPSQAEQTITLFEREATGYHEVQKTFTNAELRDTFDANTIVGKLLDRADTLRADLSLAQQENKRLCGEMERMKKERDEWKKEWETYAHAWNRELGPRRGKTHLIDELVVGTQELRARADAGDKLVAEKAAADRQAKLNADVAALDSGAHS